MIKKLYVSDYALIDSLSISPSQGLNIITGETGAGKSIILGALSLVMGARADSSSLRSNDKKCIIEATVDISQYHLEEFFKEHDLDYENPAIIRREITPAGKSRAFINDTPVLLDTLSSLSAHLIDIHSQHQTHMLSRREYRMGVLDAYCGNDVLLTPYRTALEEYRTAVKTLENLRAKQQSLNENDQYNRYLLEELQDARLSDGEEEEAEAMVERLSNAQKIKEALWQADSLLNEEDMGILTRMRMLRGELAEVGRFFPPESEIDSRMESITIDLKDIAGEVSSLLSHTDEDPALLQRTEERLSLIHSLKRKHSVNSVKELMDIESRLKEEAGILMDMDMEIQEAEKRVISTENTLLQAGKELYDARMRGAATMSGEIQEIIRSLGMKDAVFETAVRHGEKYGNDGMDETDFMFCANAGGEVSSLEKTASGGELSRVMLAIKCTLAQKSSLPTLVLDEIDTGVSGEVADRMGSLMQHMGKRMQLIVITHLPQIAAKGDIHMKVYKDVRDGVTSSRISTLSRDERINEIASMISGSSVSQAALSHAEELLNVKTN